LFATRRYYEPSLGRFLSRDADIPSFNNTQALNEFSYSLDNPIALIDPSGLSAERDGSVRFEPRGPSDSRYNSRDRAIRALRLAQLWSEYSYATQEAYYAKAQLLVLDATDLAVKSVFALYQGKGVGVRGGYDLASDYLRFFGNAFDNPTLAATPSSDQLAGSLLRRVGQDRLANVADKVSKGVFLAQDLLELRNLSNRLDKASSILTPGSFLRTKELGSFIVSAANLFNNGKP
jgi:hypothetical protein